MVDLQVVDHLTVKDIHQDQVVQAVVDSNRAKAASGRCFILAVLPCRPALDQRFRAFVNRAARRKVNPLENAPTIAT